MYKTYFATKQNIKLIDIEATPSVHHKITPTHLSNDYKIMQ